MVVKGLLGAEVCLFTPILLERNQSVIASVRVSQLRITSTTVLYGVLSFSVYQLSS
mgnify:FL=1